MLILFYKDVLLILFYKMLIEKEIITELNLESSDLFKDIDDVVEKKLKEKYEGVCFAGCKILEILEVLERTTPTMAKNELTSIGVVNVRFLVRGEYYSDNSVISKINIVHADINNYICKNENIVVHLTHPETLKQGAQIPVIIYNVRYPIMRNTIVALGTPFIPTPSNPKYYELTDYENEGTDVFKNIINNIKKLDDIKKYKNYNFFKDLLYPYKKKNKITAESFDITNVKNHKSKIGIISSTVDLSTTEGLYAKSKPTINHSSPPGTLDNPQEIDSVEFYKILLENHYKHLTLIKELCENYDPKEHKHIWDFYMKHKKTI